LSRGRGGFILRGARPLLTPSVFQEIRRVKERRSLSYITFPLSFQGEGD